MKLFKINNGLRDRVAGICIPPYREGPGGRGKAMYTVYILGWGQVANEGEVIRACQNFGS